MRSSFLTVVTIGLVAAVTLAWFAAVETRGTVATDVGEAGVALGGETARVVEQVAYHDDVVRVGDVVLVDGRPEDAIEVPEIAAVWEVVDGLLPDAERASVVQLSVIEEGGRGLVGVVHPATGGGWILSLDVADLDDRRLVEETIVHEIVHMVTLDRDVFRFGDGRCDGVRIELGCAVAGSLLADFAVTFWPDGAVVGPAGDYVNRYAMTGVHEDLAETFTSMVMGWTPQGHVVAAKVAMLAADPELAVLAEELRSSLSEP